MSRKKAREIALHLVFEMGFREFEADEILMDRLDEQDIFTAEDVRDALSSVSKQNFGEFESTEWSIVFDQETMETRYYHREDYTKHYTFSMP